MKLLTTMVALALLMACDSRPHGSKPTPALATDAAPAPADAGIAVLPHETFTIESIKLAEMRRINLWTPPGYTPDGTDRYPVLYMPDGGLAEDFPHVIRDVDAAIRAGEMRPVIVVGIENTERRRDMTGPTEVAEERKIAPHVGGSAAFRAFIKDELMPFMAKRVRGNGEAGIVGESLAGLFILETFFLDPELFDVYIVLSPSTWWNGQALARAASQRLKALPKLKATLYLTHGGDDDLDGATSGLAATIRKDGPKGLAFSYEPMLEEKHSTIYLAASPGAFRTVYPPVHQP